MVKVSVIMATYNGEKYIYKQLESIYKQTYKPDEVIICDDNSTDATLEIIMDFIRKNELDNWLVYKNKSNLGWRENFFQGCTHATGDIIFFSDQDDIWKKEKIRKMVVLFIHNNMDGLFCCRDIIDGYGNDFSERKEREYFRKRLVHLTFSHSFYTLRTLGCCECVSRKVLELYKSIGIPEYGHDSQCGQIALLLGNLWYLNEPLIKYRVHPSNSSGISASRSFGGSNLNKRIDDLATSKKWIKSIIRMNFIDSVPISELKKSYDYINTRLKYLKKDGDVTVIDLLKKKDGYPNISSFLGDIAYRHGANETLGALRWKFNQILGI